MQMRAKMGACDRADHNCPGLDRNSCVRHQRRDNDRMFNLFATFECHSQMILTRITSSHITRIGSVHPQIFNKLDTGFDRGLFLNRSGESYVAALRNIIVSIPIPIRFLSIYQACFLNCIIGNFLVPCLMAPFG